MHEHVILQTSGAVDTAQRTAGTLDGWKHGVARYAVGNSRLLLAISAAFAAPLLYLTGAESGGFHFRGSSSTGKSTALIVGGSAWGGGGIRGYVRSWRTTANGLEAFAAMHCDCLLCLDEMGQVDGREAGAIAYMLANGIGKARANKNGEAKPPAEWRVLFLSSGELGLADKIAEDGRGRRAAAGQQVRIVDLAADAGAGLGLFENLHGFETADAFARHLKLMSATNYGHPSRAFVHTLVRDSEGAAVGSHGFVDAFTKENCPPRAGEPRRRPIRSGRGGWGACQSRAHSALAAGEAIKGAKRCFLDWLGARGGVGAGRGHRRRYRCAPIHRTARHHAV